MGRDTPPDITITGLSRVLECHPNTIRKAYDAGFLKATRHFRQGKDDIRPLFPGTAAFFKHADAVVSNPDLCAAYHARFEAQPQHIGWSVMDDEIGFSSGRRTKPMDTAKETAWRTFQREEGTLIEFLKKNGAFTG